MDDLLADFLAETNESLGELDSALLRLERVPDDQATLSQIFRLVHTIKGTCGFLGLPRLERVAHAAENVLGMVRDGAMIVTPPMVSLVLAALDRIKDIVADLGRKGIEVPGDDAALIAQLDALIHGSGAPTPMPALVMPTFDRPPPPTAAPVATPQAKPATARAPRAVKSRAPASTAPAPAALAPAVAEAPAVPAAPIVALAAAEPEPAAGEPAEAQASGTQTIRVAVEVLEHLMTLVSELVLTRNQLMQLARTSQDNASAVPLQRLSHITSDLQEGVMKTRMQPIATAWAKLPRVVRDLAHELGKKIELVSHGAETELDRQVLELIRDPLTHMVRNSADHGLETPAERRAAGKSETGHIILSAAHEGGHIIIGISDDGRGLPVDRIRAKVLAKGLATPAELAALTESQIQSFIFRAGFSTASEVTSVSGRGVGMDVVKTNIERIGGTIELKSIAGQGTWFTIKIPLTLAIVSGLIVEAGGERFAIPQIGVLELVRAGAGGSAIEHINDTPVLRLREQLLPLINLANLLRLPATENGAAGGSGEYIVVAQVGGTLLGIIVDRVFDTEEIVVKPVAPILRHLTIFSGNTILGDGSVIMILDPHGIARAVGMGTASDGKPKLSAPPSESANRARSERVALLLFRAGGQEKLAVPLSLVARLEHIPRDRIEISGGQPVTQYRGRLMKLLPLMALPEDPAEWPESSPVLVFTDQDRSLGLVVEAIIDVVQDRMDIELTAARPGLLGSAVIDGRATDVIDIGHYLGLAFPDWFSGRESEAAGGAHLLLVDDSVFFRQMISPVLVAAGYRVTQAGSAQEALALREAGLVPDAILTETVLPDMAGPDFARAVRDGGAWSRLPLLALSGRAAPDAVQDARAAGFTDYVVKLDRDLLLTSLRQCLQAACA
jgi:two-component system chemotaxis sensor kinase CheA